MSNELFYVEPAAVTSSGLTISGDDARHIGKVLRKIPGEIVWVTSGDDHSYRVRIRSIAREIVECEILESSYRLNESACDLTLCVGALKNPARMDWIFEKGTELGVRRFIPMKTERTIVHSVKVPRWQKITLAAMKQSCRSFLPVVDQLKSFTEVIAHGQGTGLKLIAHEETDTENYFADVIARAGSFVNAMILIGPEGGFAHTELESAVTNGFQPVSLGKRRLRTETAAIIAAAEFLGKM
jgi:16S rRNA (uracil1498-N3)-methyltransferase